MTALTLALIAMSIILYLVQIGMVFEHLTEDKYKRKMDFWIDLIPIFPVPRYIVIHYRRLEKYR